jgi:hypothetical protein
VKGRNFAFAEHDKSGSGERAAQQAGLAFCMSPVEGEDANDLHQRAGLMTLCFLLLDMRRRPSPETTVGIQKQIRSVSANGSAAIANTTMTNIEHDN